MAFASRCAGRGSAARPLTSLSSGRDALLEGPILGMPGLIEEKPAEQARAGAGSRSEPGIAADRANYGAAAGADRRAGQRALLGRVMSAQAVMGRARAASSSNLFMAFPQAICSARWRTGIAFAQEPEQPVGGRG